MKPFLAILLVLCLQVGMSRLCLCHGIPDGDSAEVVSCCHQPDTGETKPCPHCDHLDELVLSTPSKLLLAPEASATFELPPLAVIEVFLLSGPSQGPLVRLSSGQAPFAPAALDRAFFGVFLI